jgi:hypothetical protein
MLNVLLAAAGCLLSQTSGHPPARVPYWKTLPIVQPVGEKQPQGCYTVADRRSVAWKRPRFVYNGHAATGRKLAKVIVLVYNPLLPKHDNKTLVEHFGWHDPVEYSHILADVVRQASWGYINYEIVDVIEVNGYPRRLDGTRYDEDTYLEAHRTQQWYPVTSSYRGFFEDNGILDRCRRENVTELWVWGAPGFHFDEFAGYIPNRYARFGPTENPWFYRPYDIPPEIGHTIWVMGFNYEVGADNMIHSYAHRIESMAALAMADGVWDPKRMRDPWNVFSWLEMDTPGTPSMVGNCHVPPNGQSGYDYNNKRKVLSWADNWRNYPDLRGKPRTVGSDDWGDNQFGYMKWLLERVPKYPGYTEYGYNNWWVYIANTDEDLPDYKMPDGNRFMLPEDMPEPSASAR